MNAALKRTPDQTGNSLRVKAAVVLCTHTHRFVDARAYFPPHVSVNYVRPNGLTSTAPAPAKLPGGHRRPAFGTSAAICMTIPRNGLTTRKPGRARRYRFIYLELVLLADVIEIGQYGHIVAALLLCLACQMVCHEIGAICKTHKE